MEHSGNRLGEQAAGRRGGNRWFCPAPITVLAVLAVAVVSGCHFSSRSEQPEPDAVEEAAAVVSDVAAHAPVALESEQVELVREADCIPAAAAGSAANTVSIAGTGSAVGAQNGREVVSGETVYRRQCIFCHGSGAAGAPVLGDVQQWEPRIARGYSALLESTLQGKGLMPPQTGTLFSEAEVARAVVFMANGAGAAFDAEKAVPESVSDGAAGC